MLIPIRDNAGREFPRSAERELRRRLLGFGGFTRMPGVLGEWRSGNATYRDRHRQYVVALAHWTDLPRWLEVVHWAGERLSQEAIYIEVAGVPDIVMARSRQLGGQVQDTTDQP